MGLTAIAEWKLAYMETSITRMWEKMLMIVKLRSKYLTTTKIILRAVHKSETGCGPSHRNAVTDEDKNNSWRFSMRIARVKEPMKLANGEWITHVIKDSEETPLIYIGGEYFYNEKFQPVSEKQERKIFNHPVFQRWLDRLSSHHAYI
jgi:hypothetical protein